MDCSYPLFVHPENMDDHGTYIPSRNEIEEACKKYQSSWSSWERYQRRSTPTPILNRYANAEHLNHEAFIPERIYPEHSLCPSDGRVIRHTQIMEDEI